LLIAGFCEACIYYVDTTSTGSGGRTTPETSGPHAAWRNISEITGLSPGDSVLFHRGNTWAEQLVTLWSVESNKVIAFGAYGSLIDVSGYWTYARGVYMNGINYVTVQSLRIKGSGGGAFRNITGAG